MAIVLATDTADASRSVGAALASILSAGDVLVLTGDLVDGLK